MTDVLCVYGTRPEGIKMAPVIQELGRRTVDHTVCVTAQHRGLLDQVNTLFGIEPYIDLDVMAPGQSPTRVASQVLAGLETVLAEVEPDWLLVQGDTTTVVAAALAGAYAGIPVAHLEAGLRTGDRSQPFPEEINRIATTAVSSLHFAPTRSSVDALRREGVSEDAIVLTGNTVIDALLWVSSRSAEPNDSCITDSLDASKRLILLTVHRREIFGAPLARLLRAIRDLAVARRSEIEILCPVHPNPEVAEPVRATLGALDNVVLSEPLDYASLARVLARCEFVLTDSGGLQEEAPALGKPVLVLRERTERPEAVDIGAARLVGTDADAITTWTSILLDDAAAYARMVPGFSPYGDGKAAQRVVSALLGEPVTPFEPPS